jgi:hypothetical protein
LILAQLAGRVQANEIYHGTHMRVQQQNLGNGQCWTPLFLENVQANTPIAIDIGMKDLCSECNLHSSDRQKLFPQWVSLLTHNFSSHCIPDLLVTFTNYKPQKKGKNVPISVRTT